MSRSGVALVLMVATALGASTARAQVGAWCDPDSSLPALDGTIDPTEYSGSSTGVGDGFGGMIGTGVTMHLDSDATGNLALAIDATSGTCAWGPDDTVVLYVDAIPAVGFADTTGFDDAGDPGRAAASGMGTDLSRADLTFAPGFTADHAIVLRGDSATLFRLQAGGPHTFVRGLSRAPASGFDAACVREVAGFSMSDLGSQPGNPFRWVATLINASNAFRSNELQGAATAPAANIGAAAYALAAGDRNTFEAYGPPVGFAGSFAWIDFGTFDASGFQPTPTCGQLSSNTFAIGPFSDGTLAFGDTQVTPSTDFTRGVPTTPNVSTGGVYAFNVATNDRALGIQPAGGDFATSVAVGGGKLTIRVQNTSGVALADPVVAYAFLYRNDSPRSTYFNGSWSVDGTTFTDVPEFAATTPIDPDSTTPAEVGWTRTTHSATLTGVTVPAGGAFYLRFTSNDDAGMGGRDELALDDVVIAPNYERCGNGLLDLSESCDDGATNGTTPCGCQADCSFGASGTACGDAGAGACDAPDTCDGAGACVDRVSASGIECRASSGEPCDVAEVCDGTSAECPADAVSPAGTVCAAADPLAPCDADDVCDGVSAACNGRVADAGTACRAPMDLCDLGASCDGAGTSCPASVAAPSGTPCRAVAGLCDAPESCDGASLACPPDLVLVAGTPCREATGACDLAEACTGSSAACPADGAAPDGTACADALACNGAEMCMAGVCTDAPDLDCDDGDLCTSDSCAEPGSCGHSAIAGCCNLSTDCDDGDLCTLDTCSGPGGTCSSSPITSCCTSDADCGDASACTTDSCDLTTNRCVFDPIPSCCDGAADCDDGDVCTADACEAGGTCSMTPIAGCCASDADCDDGDACTADACDASNTCSHDGIAGCCASDADCDDGDACTIDRCDETTLRCAADPMDCDDGDACTMDSCVDGSCESTPSCDDGGIPDDGGIALDGGLPDAGTSDAGTDAGAHDDAAVDPDASVGPDGGNAGVDAGPDPMPAGGCGCRAAGGSGAPAWPALFGAVLWVAFRRRARRRA